MSDLYHPYHVSNSIIEKHLLRGDPLTPRKLNLLLFILASEYYSRTGSQLMEGEWHIYSDGLDNSIIQDHYAEGCSTIISSYITDDNGEVSKITPGEDTVFDSCLELVLFVSKNYSAVALSNILRAPDSAWKHVWVSGGNVIRDEDAGARVESYRTYLGVAF